jgi:hypothetical protein
MNGLHITAFAKLHMTDAACLGLFFREIPTTSRIRCCQQSPPRLISLEPTYGPMTEGPGHSYPESSGHEDVGDVAWQGDSGPSSSGIVFPRELELSLLMPKLWCFLSGMRRLHRRWLASHCQPLPSPLCPGV